MQFLFSSVSLPSPSCSYSVLRCRLKWFLIHLSKSYTTRINEMLHFPSVISRLDPKVEASVDPRRPRTRNHPGIMNVPTVKLPLDLRRSLLFALGAGGLDIPAIRLEAKKLADILGRRHPPWTRAEIELKKRQLAHRIADEPKFKVYSDNTEEEVEKISRLREESLAKRMKESVYKWKPIDYTTPHKCFTYSFARLAQDYAILRRVLKEIWSRDPEFGPSSVLDFGSGIGTSFWVTKEYWRDFKDFTMVDISPEMNEVAQTLIRGGDKDGAPMHPGVYSRQFLPTSSESGAADLVMSAFTLMELPSLEERARIIQSLWERTNKYLVLVENGSYTGNSWILYARDLILAGGNEVARSELNQLLESYQLDAKEVKEILGRKDLWESRKLELIQSLMPDGVKVPTVLESGQVFAPCPHDMTCPKQALNDPAYCHFKVRYNPLSLNDTEAEETLETKFSFVILRKGKASSSGSSHSWPRLVQDVLERRRHAVARMCSSRGVLEEVIATKKKCGNVAYKILKSSHLGDLLPVETELKAKLRDEEEGPDSNLSQRVQ